MDRHSTSAGAALEPGEMKQHGRDNPMGSHDGDLPNVTACGADQKTDDRADKLPDLMRLNGVGGLLDADGGALLIHEKADDYTGPSRAATAASASFAVYSSRATAPDRPHTLSA